MGAEKGICHLSRQGGLQKILCDCVHFCARLCTCVHVGAHAMSAHPLEPEKALVYCGNLYGEGR